MAKVEERVVRDTKFISKIIVQVLSSHSDPTCKGILVAGWASPNSPDHPRPYSCTSIAGSDTHVLESSPEIQQGFSLSRTAMHRRHELRGSVPRVGRLGGVCSAGESRA
jgi:hypothetical protein